MYLSKIEEIIVIIAAGFIVIGFVVSTIKNIQQTIAEEKQKEEKKKSNERKIRDLIKYMEVKKELTQLLKKKTPPK